MKHLVMVLVLSLVGWTYVAARGLQPVAFQELQPMDLQLEALDDSVDYLVYRYTAHNPGTSTQGIASIRLDVSASSGPIEASLPATGDFLDGSAFTSQVPLAPHARIGPISPSGWWAALDRATPFLSWFEENGGMFDRDSIAPGDSLAGLGIRSTYYPAIREVGAVPTWQSCCQEPWGTEEENPMRLHHDPAHFEVTSYAIAPGYRAEEITTPLFKTQVETVCGSLSWIDNSSLCSEFFNLAQGAMTDYIVFNDPYAAATKLSQLRDRVDEEQAEMEPDAYWLLYYNVRRAYWNVAPPLKVDCTPTTVERGASVSCVPTPPPGVPFEVTGWGFVDGSGSGLDVVTSGTAPASWNGAMAVGGTISVYALVDSMADTATTAVQVNPRSWSGIAIANPIPEQAQTVLGDMPTVPESEADLAHFHNSSRILRWPDDVRIQKHRLEPYVAGTS